MGDFTISMPVGGTGNTCSLMVQTSTFHVEDESYKTTPQIYWRYRAHSFYGWYMVSNCDTLVLYTGDTWNKRVATSVQYIQTNYRIGFFDNPNTGSITASISLSEYAGQSQAGYDAVVTTLQNTQELPADVLGFADWRVDDIPQSVLSTNIPIFQTNQECWDYIRTGVGLKNALNYVAPETPDGEIFEIDNCWTHGTWLNDTQPQVTEIHYRNFRAKMTAGKFALYPISGIVDGKLKMGIKNDATFYDMEYSTDGRTWYETIEFPFEYFLRRRVRETGEFDYALTFTNSKIPEFEDEETAQGYIDGDVPITDATNWGEISTEYPAQLVTGEDDDETEMGQVYTRSFFSQQYICSAGAIQEISNAFFDTDNNIFENIKRGLEMYGDSIIDDIQNITFYPLDLSTVFTNVSNQNYIFFGGYQFQLTNHTVDKIIYPNGYYDFGSFDIGYQWGKTYRSYAPYTRLFVYLPYIGWKELDIARYVGKTVRVVYYIDTRTAGCLACLFTGYSSTNNGVLVDYFNGQIGVQMPIKLTDYSAYANAQIQTLLGGGANLGNGGELGGFASSFMNGVGSGLVESGAVSMAGMGIAGLGVTGAIQTTKTMYGLTQNNINNFNKTKGASTSMLNQYLPQYVMFMVETQDADITPNEYTLMGRPTNASGQLQDFAGYLEVDSVKLDCPIATDEEKAEIIAQLQNGIYI